METMFFYITFLIETIEAYEMDINKLNVSNFK